MGNSIRHRPLPPLPEWAQRLGLSWDRQPAVRKLFLGKAVLWKDVKDGHFYCNLVDGLWIHRRDLGIVGDYDAIYEFLHACYVDYYFQELLQKGIVTLPKG